MSDDVCWKCNTNRGYMKFEDYVYCGDCYDDELHEVAHKRLEEINRLMPILAAKDAEIERLKTHLASASCPHGCFSGDNGRYLSDGSFSKCDWCTARKSYIKEQNKSDN